LQQKKIFILNLNKNKMKLNLVNLGVLAASMLIFASCNNDDDDIDVPEIPEIVVPDTFSFSVDGSSTVSFGGQTDRLTMATEIFSELDATQSTVTKEDLRAMFNDGKGFSTAALNDSGKKLGNKVGAYQTAEVKANVILFFDDILVDFADNVAPVLGNDAAAGVAGMSGGNRQLNAKGVELDQAFAKGLIGALCVDQIANGYLSDAKIGDAVDNETRDPSEDSNATAMEHHWDEGYGYVYGLESNADVSDILLKKYLDKDGADSGYEGYSADVTDAFIYGRAAIVAKNSEVRDAQAAIISEKISEVVINKAVYYLNSAAGKDDLSADYFHALSEGYGFIFSLQFTYDAAGAPYFTNAEVTGMLDELLEGDGFWDRTDAELEAMATTIAAKL
jgi:hypothetical protein